MIVGSLEQNNFPLLADQWYYSIGNTWYDHMKGTHSYTTYYVYHVVLSGNTSEKIGVVTCELCEVTCDM